MDEAGDQGNEKTWIFESGAKRTCFPGMLMRRGETGATHSSTAFIESTKNNHLHNIPGAPPWHA